MEINTNTSEVIITILLSILFLGISISFASYPFKVLNLFAKLNLSIYRLMGLSDNDIKHMKNPLGVFPSQRMFRDIILDPNPNPEDYERLIKILKILGISLSTIIGVPLILTIGILLFRS